VNRDVEPPTDPRYPGLYQLPDGRRAERVPDRCPRCHTSWFIGDGQNKVLVGSRKCHCPAVRERGGSVHRTHPCLVCQLEVYTPPLNEETCRLGEIRMMAPDHGLTGIEHTRQTGKPWWPERPESGPAGRAGPVETG
jgi:hypothetical protein